MNGLGLSAEALTRRQGYVCASDAAKVLNGQWPELYREKKGLTPPEDLSGILAVQMGSFTEPFGLAWYMKQTGREVTYYTDNRFMANMWLALAGKPAYPEFVISERYPWLACSLDAKSTTSKGHRCVLDQKHVGTFRYEELVLRYTPAGTHQAIVCGTDWWVLSVLIGNGKFELVEQEVDAYYRERYIARSREFWSWVERGEEPPDMSDPLPPPKPAPRLRVLDASATVVGSDEWKKLVSNNNWLPDLYNHVARFAETEGAHKAYGAARAGIQSLLPEDVGAIFLDTPRGTFSGKRSTTGAITMKMGKNRWLSNQ